MSSTVVTETFEATPGGMNLAVPANELDNSEAVYLQDALVDYPGLTRRRGPVQRVTGVASLSYKGTGLAMTLDPTGVDRYGYLGGTSSNGYFTVLSDTKTTEQTSLAWPWALPTGPPTNPYHHVDIATALNGGVWIGTSSAYDANSPKQALALWRGANRANYITTVSATLGSTDVSSTGGFSTNVCPGMFLFANTDEGYTNAYIGVVKKVNNNTNLTLETASPYAITSKSGTFQALRGFAPKVVKGEITCDVSSTTVSGGGTKFASQGLGAGTWQLYRQRDMAFVGKVASVVSNTSLTLAANAAVACADESFVALQADADYTLPTTGTQAAHKTGFLNSVYAGMQFYANQGSSLQSSNYIWFSDPSDPEGVDLSTFDGDWIEIPSVNGITQPIQKLMPTYNALLILKQNEVFALYGTDPSSFQVQKLLDDGCLDGMSVQPYGGGAIWAGRDGIYFYDGSQVTNIAASKLGDYYKATMRTFDPTKYRMYSCVNRDHYMVFIENIAPTVPVEKGNVSSEPTQFTICVNIPSGAFTMHTNLNFRGSIVLPAQSGGEHVWYLVNDVTRGYICDGEAIFNVEGVDQIGCDGNAPGPDFYFVSKKFDGGDALRLKRFKQLAMHYLAAGDSINVDCVLGLNDVGETVTTTFLSSTYTWQSLVANNAVWDQIKSKFPTWGQVIGAVFLPQRVKFFKKSQHFQFKLYQNSNQITRLRIGPYQIAYKLSRPGRVN